MTKRGVFYCPWTVRAGCAHGANCLAKREHDADPTKPHACYGWHSEERAKVAEVRKFQSRVGKSVGPLLPKRSPTNDTQRE